MHDDRRQVEERLQRVLAERVRPAIHPQAVPLDLSVWHVPGEPVALAEALDAPYEPFTVGTPWGRPWSTSWIRANGAVPAAWAGRRVEALFDLGFVGDWPGGQAEALVYRSDGLAVKAINPRNQYVAVANPAVGGEPVSLLLEAAANPDILADGFKPTLLGDRLTAGNEPLYRMARADLAVLDETVWHLSLDMEVLSQLMAELAPTDPRRHEILRALERSMDSLDLQNIPATAAAARGQLAQALSRPASKSAHRFSAVGHAHIDSAWLWPLRETKRKTARTFANVTALAHDYTELVFACSQAQQYAWVKERYPEIYARIAEAVRTGTWVPVGGMWVEADGNLPGGEALARQLVHGKRFFLEEFGVECTGVWLPDSFGYTAAYPQLARLAGMDWFLTQKLSWNQTNKLPHHTFWWEGLDGSRVFTHFPPVDTYNATFTGAELAHAVRNYAEKGRGTTSLVPFGHGDGGGGPTREMLERARRLRDLEGSGRVAIENPNVFFAAAQAEYPDAPVWSGELYLELHRATYTSQARTKAGNRRSEHLLREAELWSATAAVLTGFDYPYDELDRIWKVVLLHQFHDILPGSSIAWVHREAEQTYGEVAEQLSEIIAAATASLIQADDPEAGPRPWIFNASPWARAEVVALPAAWAPSGAQALSDGSVAAHVRVPPSGAAPLAQPHLLPSRVSASDRTLDNGLVRVQLDDDGLLVSIMDLVERREVLAPGERGNLLRLHSDLPNRWDAWDVDWHYQHRFEDLTAGAQISVVDAGPLVGAIRVAREFGQSRIVQTIRLHSGSRRVDVEVEADWHEVEKLLKVSLPLDVHADRSAAEIQFGHVFRPTHSNTSWDSARFETFCHRWVHVGEPGYGIAIVNDSTYGHDISRTSRPDGGTTTMVRLSLLRAPRSPDPAADQGHHRMTYAILPGAGIADAVEHGYALNLPLRLERGSNVPAPPPLVTTQGQDAADDSTVIEAVKLADDQSGDVIVRLYESAGGRARSRLTTAFPITAAETCDLLERPLSAESITVRPDGSLELVLRPFQILTLRLRRG